MNVAKIILLTVMMLIAGGGCKELADIADSAAALKEEPKSPAAPKEKGPAVSEDPKIPKDPTETEEPAEPDKKSPAVSEKPDEPEKVPVAPDPNRWDSTREIPLRIRYDEARNWMSRIPDSTSLAELSIPGTHNTGALHDPPGGFLTRDTAKNQDKTYREQLDMGVRFFDIRNHHYRESGWLSYGRHEFLIYHGIANQHSKFEDVLKAVDEFLKDNPTETLIMSIKPENGSSGTIQTFEETFRWYMANSHAKDRWYIRNEIPKLGDVRGRIVLLRRFGASGELGINANGWRGNSPNSLPVGAGEIRIQDYFNVGSAGEKYKKILPMFLEAHRGPTATLYLNLTSAHTKTLGLPQITTVSTPVNKIMVMLLKSFGTGRLGVLIADYIHKELALRIVNANFIESDPAEFREAFDSYCAVIKNSRKPGFCLGAP